MNLNFNISDISRFSSGSQRVRVASEDWVSRNMFCPICGSINLCEFKNNSPVADFYCDKCNEEFELKSKESKRGDMGKKIVDGAYSTMIERITALNNPNFFFLTYNEWRVNNLLLVPKYFFTTDIIEQRKPLADSARRAGWVGCNIIFDSIPECGKIYVIKQGIELPKSEITERYSRAKLLSTNNLESRGWLMDTLSCVDQIHTNEFSINDIYAFESALQERHPNNNFVKDKIRQQLQYLRDRGFIEFTARGRYRKL